MNFDTLALIALMLAAIPCGMFLLNLFVYRRLPPFSLAPGFSRVDSGVEARNRLSGLDSAHAPDTGLKPGANERLVPPRVSVLIPARNEETNIRTTLEAVLANRGGEFEVIVLDDHSTDGTASIVSEFATRDARVRLECAPPLPAGWCGKQHACHVLAKLARHPLLVFIDADVRLAPDALARMGGFMARDSVLDCGSPLPLSDASQSARGLAQSKTSRTSTPLVNRKS